MASWPRDDEELDAEQRRLAALQPPPWVPGEAMSVAAAFVAFGRGQPGRGAAGDRGWVGAVCMLVPSFRTVDRAAFGVLAGARYDPGRLARRLGPALEAGIRALSVRPDVVMVDATGRDHPRGAGLALHLGAVLDVPTVGVTHRPLLARGAWPPEEPGAIAPLVLSSTVVGAWVRTQAHARPLAVHAAWRTDPEVAVAVVQRCVAGARTPEPLRAARELARTTRSRDQ